MFGKNGNIYENWPKRGADKEVATFMISVSHSFRPYSLKGVLIRIVQVNIIFGDNARVV